MENVIAHEKILPTPVILACKSISTLHLVGEETREGNLICMKVPLSGHVPNYHPRFRGLINFARESEGTPKASSICVRQCAVCANYNSLSGNPQAGRNDIDKNALDPWLRGVQTATEKCPGPQYFYYTYFCVSNSGRNF